VFGSSTVMLQYTTSSLLLGQTLSQVFEGTVTLSTSASSSASAGPYPITFTTTLSCQVPCNYDVTYQVGTYTIEQASSSVFLDSIPTSYTYGDSLSVSGEVCGVSASAPTGQVQLVLDGNGAGFGSAVALSPGTSSSCSHCSTCAVFSFSATPQSPSDATLLQGLSAGSHQLTASYGGDVNYLGSSTAQASSLSVSAATLTITPVAHHSTYGSSLSVPAAPAALAGVLTSDYTVSGLQLGQLFASVFQGAPSLALPSSVTSVSSVGHYSITASQGTLSCVLSPCNYALSFGSGDQLYEIQPFTPSVSVVLTPSMVVTYGNAVLVQVSVSGVAAAAGGSVPQGSVLVSVSSSSSPAFGTVTLSGCTSLDANGACEIALSPTDPLPSVLESLSSNSSPYVFSASYQPSSPSNYASSSGSSGSLQVSPAQLTLMANDVSSQYGAPLVQASAFTYTASGFQFSQQLADLYDGSPALTSDVEVDAGVYHIFIAVGSLVCKSTQSCSYSFTFNNGHYTVLAGTT
jgi:hypothetical protein